MARECDWAMEFSFRYECEGNAQKKTKRVIVLILVADNAQEWGVSIEGLHSPMLSVSVSQNSRFETQFTSGPLY